MPAQTVISSGLQDAGERLVRTASGIGARSCNYSAGIGGRAERQRNDKGGGLPEEYRPGTPPAGQVLFDNCCPAALRDANANVMAMLRPTVASTWNMCEYPMVATRSPAAIGPSASPTS
jgi:hypothetical protein